MAKQRGGTNTGGGNSKIVNVGVKAGSRQRNLTGPANATQPGAIEFQGSRPLIRAVAKAFGPGMGNDLATNIGKGGPGTGRTLYGCGGTQGQWSPGNLGPNGKPKV
jgi:hypothetical protein